MTLYEVDEAASRIREEVDADANIILGATFDDSLQGKIRVSVVATGTDALMVQALDPVKPSTTRQPLQAKRPVEAPAQAPAASAETPAERPQVAAQMSDDAFEAAVASAIRTAPAGGSAPRAAVEDNGVVIEPYTPQPAHREPVEEAPRAPEAAMPRPYVPSGAERPQLNRRVPRQEELPAVARRQLEEPRSEEPRNARALFRRLASNVGLNLGQDQSEAAPQPHQRREFDDVAARAAIEAAAPRVQRTPEGAAGSLDAHGRASTQPTPAPRGPP